MLQGKEDMVAVPAEKGLRFCRGERRTLESPVSFLKKREKQGKAIREQWERKTATAVNPFKGKEKKLGRCQKGDRRPPKSEKRGI